MKRGPKSITVSSILSKAAVARAKKLAPILISPGAKFDLLMRIVSRGFRSPRLGPVYHSSITPEEHLHNALIRGSLIKGCALPLRGYFTLDWSTSVVVRNKVDQLLRVILERGFLRCFGHPLF